MTRISLLLPDESFRCLKAVSERSGVSVSEIIRRAISADPVHAQAWHQLRSEIESGRYFTTVADVAERMDGLLKVDVLTEIRAAFDTASRKSRK